VRFVVVGAGAVGGVVGGRLAQHGHDVVLVARGAHRAAMEAEGLLLRDPDGEVRVHPPVVGGLAEAEPGPDDVVLVAVKGQDTATALGDLPAGTAVACLQNGVDNERRLLRRTPRVYAVPVMLPATHLEPGVVDASSAPTTGILDVGCYPTGVDDTARAIAATFESSSFSSIARPDVMRFKWSKLLLNLGNALEAACGTDGYASPLYEAARVEGRTVIEVAGIDAASDEEDRERRGDLISMRRIAGQRRGGGSTWQSLARGSGVETDYLNGEIALLGRLHGVPTPANARIQALMTEAAGRGSGPGGLTPAQLLSELRR
jgi:2-dehydropantoate 2-reductase